MTHGSQTIIDYRHRHTIFIAALIVIGVCLFATILALSFFVPLAVENESNLIGGLYWLP